MILTSHTETLSDLSCSVYASIPFKFIVEGEPFYIHTDLVSLHSKPLDRMMNGHMAEAQKGFAILEDVDKNTFVRFIEWAHKKYYTAANFTTVLEQGSDSAGLCIEDECVAEKAVQRTNNPAVEDDGQMSFNQDIAVAQVIEEDDGWGRFARPSSRKVKSKRRDFCPESPTPRTAKEDIRHSFISRRPVKRKSAIKVPPPRGNRSSAEVYSDVFLSHARLYVFAEKYDIQALKMLALDELHATLAIYTLYTKRTSDIIDLLRYVYCNTSEASEGVENLRTLMTQYMGCELDILTYDEDFKGLMIEEEGADEGGGLLSDFMKMVGKRISDEVRLDEH